MIKRLYRSVACGAALLLFHNAARAELSKADEPLTVNWYHGAEALRPVIDAYTRETGRTVTVTDDYDTFNTDVVLVSDYKGLTEGKKFKHFQKLKSAVAERLVPARWRDREGYWVGIVLRARAPIYNKAMVAPADVPRTWFDLADPRWRGKIKLRGADNVYNRTLLAWLIHHHGEARAEAWARSVIRNAGPNPVYEGDTPNAGAVARGQFPLSFANTYYLGYMQGLWAARYGPGLVERVGIAWMDQGGRGQHVNVTGAAIHDDTEKADEARHLIEWLLSDTGQRLLSEHVYKYPVRPDVAPSPYLRSLGLFRPDTTDLNDLEFLYDRADQVFRRVGWAQPW